MSLENIKIVLVRTFHPGNIGSAARSMKTMGLSNLCLVSPKDFPSTEAEKMAAGATDLLESATIYESIQEAIEDCSLVVASTARPRGYDLPVLSPEKMARRMHVEAKHGPVALIFGPERMGLHNEDIQLAKYRVTIPANPNYSSLNMAAAVQTLSYEVYKASLDLVDPSRLRDHEQLPTSREIELLLEHAEQVLRDISFLRPHQGETMLRIRNLLTRAEPKQIDVNILRGILSSIEKKTS